MQDGRAPSSRLPTSGTGDAGAAPRLSRADGPGPFPAAGGLHGCIGLSGHSVTIADRLKSPGHVALASIASVRAPRASPSSSYSAAADRGLRPRRGAGGVMTSGTSGATASGADVDTTAFRALPRPTCFAIVERRSE